LISASGRSREAADSLAELNISRFRAKIGNAGEWVQNISPRPCRRLRTLGEAERMRQRNDLLRMLNVPYGAADGERLDIFSSDRWTGPALVQRPMDKRR